MLFIYAEDAGLSDLFFWSYLAGGLWQQLHNTLMQHAVVTLVVQMSQAFLPRVLLAKGAFQHCDGYTPSSPKRRTHPISS